MRYKKPAIILATLFFSAFAIIALLAFLSKNININKNGFNRQLVTSTLKIRKQATYPIQITRMIGTRAGKLYFQGGSAYNIYSTNLNLDSFTNIQLPIQQQSKLNSGVRMYLNGAHVYLSCKNFPEIIDYNLDSGTANPYVLKSFYSKEVPYSKDQFIIRLIDKNSKDPVFIKLDIKNENSKQVDHFSEKNGEGNFPTDGILYYDSTTHLGCYTHFYQNGFICMDTNLNLTLKARTIDTLTKRQVKVAHVGHSSTMKDPPQYVNMVATVAKGNLYLQSMLQADNEFPLDFEENSAIDIYSLTTGAYKGSFYIPAFKGRKTYEFHIIDNNLIALYGKTVVTYELNLPDISK
ncbi:hypothetical protein A4D02_23975 [Niastella koreensis]|uniref:Uncharacterized protein n=2 Tax=Niastella koreensis TaxID=354356 RepID=G8TC82_NIAKG|nr:hypothetical protein [Niastella koreensis]AEW00389.1 hypothetical protein Niako_4111 [Niastella koreensis GR20-10]OQP52255.1 hypothetical protein A4D02_23975 [Niastella koreensis]